MKAQLLPNLESDIYEFLRGERFTARELTNGLSRKYPEITLRNVILGLQRLKKDGKVENNSTTNKWRCLYES